eukprot:361609-Chlamydomonas_euryale.AAC.2
MSRSSSVWPLRPSSMLFPVLQPPNTTRAASVPGTLLAKSNKVHTCTVSVVTTLPHLPTPAADALNCGWWQTGRRRSWRAASGGACRSSLDAHNSRIKARFLGSLLHVFAVVYCANVGRKHSATTNQQPQVKTQQPRINSQKSQIKSQLSWIKSQRPRISIHKPNLSNDTSASTNQNPSA